MAHALARGVSCSTLRAPVCMVARLTNSSRPRSSLAAGQGRHWQLRQQLQGQQPQQQQRRRSTVAAAPRCVVCCASASGTVDLKIEVEGMKCGGCSSRVEDTLKAMQQVKGVQVDLESKLAQVQVEAGSMADAMKLMPVFVTAINDLGFEAKPSSQ